ncbi:TPA: hypothetical protein DIC40_05695 [Patescibacteria group bacterium]|nr:hypothetical protein P148_SR1C00001G0689 [candidate division SR1 bacterium RAAC1_SR1_1]HCY21306.1 hypothetical protein [Candidatus Gracilibacteria bacterium]
MFKSTKVLLVGAFLTLVAFASMTKAQVSTDVYLTILGGNVTIGTTGAFDFGSFPVASTDTNVEKQFTGADYFRVDDMKGADLGYYTTLQVTDLTGDNGTIPAANISTKVSSVTTTKINGTDNANVVVSNTLLNYTPLNSAITFIKRDTAANTGKLGRYAAFPFLQVTIPAYQSVGSYHATLTYTIIEN